MEDQKARDKRLKKAEKLAKLQLKLERIEKEKRWSSGNAQPKARKAAAKNTRNDGYDPGSVEARWVAYWKEHMSFHPKESSEGKIFSICIPPPNVTGSLHIGHAMMIAIEDCIVRYKRLNGHEVLYLPGLDHAGIATQNVVMKSINQPVSRDEFMNEAYKWTERFGNRICEQFDRMGCSVDYSRKVFTLDPGMSRSVSHAFVQLYRRGLIYRENKLVNWSGKMKTTLSDLEVDYKDIKGGTYLEVDGGKYKFGVMYYIKYHLSGSEDEPASSAYVIVGTTRPETILGDTALCANPEDPRFKNVPEILSTGVFPDPLNERIAERLKAVGISPDETKQLDKEEEKSLREGQRINEELKAERKNKFKKKKEAGQSRSVGRTGIFAVNPLTGRHIPVVFDEMADLSFGTGILKVTPAHDPTDYQIGKAHQLETVAVFTEENTIRIEGCYEGMGRFEARKRVLADLKSSGALVKEELHDQILPVCSRSGDIVEPLVKEQWWMRCGEMAAKAAEGVRSGDIKLVPEEAHATWFRWLDGIKD